MLLRVWRLGFGAGRGSLQRRSLAASSAAGSEAAVASVVGVVAASERELNRASHCTATPTPTAATASTVAATAATAIVAVAPGVAPRARGREQLHAMLEGARALPNARGHDAQRALDVEHRVDSLDGARLDTCMAKTQRDGNSGQQWAAMASSRRPLHFDRAATPSANSFWMSSV